MLNQKANPRHILQQIAAIDRMEHGKLSMIRQGPGGRSYFNLQRREGGRNVTEYVPSEQVAKEQENIDSYNCFQSQVSEYENLIAARSR